MAPYYMVMRLPGAASAEFVLMLPMVPSQRQNMIAWLAARCDPPNYGKLIAYEFPKDKLVYAYYTTSSDNRIARFKLGDTPQPILTGLRRGLIHNGGRIAFGEALTLRRTGCIFLIALGVGLVGWG